MYRCDVHGDIDSEWCDDCGKIVSRVQCEHSDRVWYNGYIETKDGETEVEVLCCENCGCELDARLKHNTPWRGKIKAKDSQN